MDLNSKMQPEKISHKVILRILVCVLILLAGVLGMSKLASLKKPPAENDVKERPLRVETMVVTPADIPIHITGYGEARTLTEVVISPEISGRVVAVHPRLHAGETVSKGEMLFEIDQRNYQAAVDEASAAVDQFNNTVRRLKKQYAVDLERLSTLKRNQELAKAEYGRLHRLFERDNVGTRTGVETAERALNNATDLVDQMNLTLEVYPFQIREAESGLASAEARLSLARTNRIRCLVKAPFTGRIKSSMLEKGQYVSPGQQVLTLADDSQLEIRVPLDSRDARKWLQFSNKASTRNTAWFAGLKPVPCSIRWTEDKNGHAWTGRLHRVVNFDQKTRTLTVAVRINGSDIVSQDPDRLPLVEGMFCTIRIPGKTLTGVFKIPRQAVSFENTVFVVVDHRLKTVAVTVSHSDDEFIYVSGGLENGATLITTRLVDPLENSLIEIISGPGGKRRS